MQLTVYAFNDGYSLASYLNSLIHFFGGDDWGGLVFLVVSLGMAGGLFMAASASSPVNFIRSMFWPAVMYAAVFGPPCQLNIQDEFSNEVYTVSQVPFGIGLALSTTTAMEKAVIDLCEDYIEPVNAVKFKEFDFFGQVRAISETLVSDLGKNEPLKQTISQYFDDCVLHGFADASINQWNFLTSSDLMVAMETPYNVFFTTVYNSDGTTTVKTCADAYHNVISPRVMGMGLSNSNDSPLAQVASVFGRRASDLAGIRSSLNNLASVYFSGHQDTADILFRQNFMMNALRSNLAQNNPQALGALTEAELKQKTGMASAAAVYIKQLPNLRAMFKLVILGLLPLTGAFFFIGWGKPLLHWFAALLWVSLFLPIEAIIHAAYMTHSVNELRGLIDVYGGFTWNNQIEILTWVSDTATIAGTLMFMIPSLTGMVLGWIAPKAGMAISSMLAGSRAHDRLVMSGGQGALEGAEQRGLARDQDQMNQMMMEAGDRYAGIAGHINQMGRFHTGGFVSNNHGQSPWMNQSSGNILNQKSGEYTISSQDAAQHIQGLTDQYAIKQGVMTAATSQAAYQALNSHDINKADSQFHELLNSTDKATANSLSHAKEEAFRALQENGYDKTYSKDQLNQLASQVAMAAYASGSVGANIPGTEIGFEASAEGKIQGSSTSTESASESHRINEAVKSALQSSEMQKITEEVRQSTRIAESDRDGKQYSEGFRKSDSFTDTLSKMKSYSTEVNKTRTSLDNYQATISASGNQEIRTGQQIFGVMDQSTLYALQNENGFENLGAAINRGASVDTLRSMAFDDFLSMDTADKANALGVISKLDHGSIGELAGNGAAILGVQAGFVDNASMSLGDGSALNNQVANGMDVIVATTDAKSVNTFGDTSPIRPTNSLNDNTALPSRYGDGGAGMAQKFNEENTKIEGKWDHGSPVNLNPRDSVLENIPKSETLQKMGDIAGINFGGGEKK